MKKINDSCLYCKKRNLHWTSKDLTKIGSIINKPLKDFQIVNSISLPLDYKIRTEDTLQPKKVLARLEYNKTA